MAIISCPHCGKKHREDWCAQKRKHIFFAEDVIPLEFGTDEADGDFVEDDDTSHNNTEKPQLIQWWNRPPWSYNKAINSDGSQRAVPEE